MDNERLVKRVYEEKVVRRDQERDGTTLKQVEAVKTMKYWGVMLSGDG